MTDDNRYGPYCASCGHPPTYHGANFCIYPAGSTVKRDCDCSGYFSSELFKASQEFAATQSKPAPKFTGGLMRKSEMPELFLRKENK